VIDSPDNGIQDDSRRNNRMPRKRLSIALGLAALGGIAVMAPPLLAQFGPVPFGPCYGPPQFKPVVVNKFPLPKPPEAPVAPPPAPAAAVMPPAAPVSPGATAKPPQAGPLGQPPQVQIFSSGPLPTTTAKPVVTGPEEPLADAEYVPPAEMELVPPIQPPKTNPPATIKPKMVPLPLILIEPAIQPTSAKKENTGPKVETGLPKTPQPPSVTEDVQEVKPGTPAIDLLIPPSVPKSEEPPLAPIQAKPKQKPTPNTTQEFTMPGGNPSSPWVIRVEVKKTVTHLIASSKSVEFHVQCQNLKVQSPTGDIQAEGKIKVSAAGLDMNCERLTISWQNDWVLMEGKVRLQTQKDAQQLELSGDKLQLKLTTLTSTSALKAIQPLLHQSAYPPVTESITPAPQAAPTPANPGVSSSPPTPFYKRVTTDDE
jgi:hypothetical protein